MQYLVHDAGREITYLNEGDLDLSNMNEIFSHSNENNSIGKIGNKIINLILCTLSYCILYYTRILIYSDKTNNIFKIPCSPPTLQRTQAYTTSCYGPPPSFPVLCKYNTVCDILFLI